MTQPITGNSDIGWCGRDIMTATGGALISGDPARCFSGVGIDSRQLAGDAVFVAIIGRTHDAHRFCDQVAAAGERGLVVAAHAVGHLPLAQWRRRSVFCVAVDDTTRALGDLAAFHRARHPAQVVGVTGSCGKTTTREMIVSVLGRRFSILSSRKNFNNEIGLPLTLLALGADHQWAVAEMGMNRSGEIARLGAIARPDIGVITNVGPAHLEGLVTVDRVMEAKAELLPAICPGGTAVLNADDPRGLLLADRAQGGVVLFGEHSRAHVRACAVSCCGAHTRFQLHLPEQAPVSVRLGVPGRFMVANALAAAAVGHLAGLDAGTVAAGLGGFRPVSGRMCLTDTPKGIHVIDDTYNANPLSMAAAIDTLAAVRKGARSILVLGDMLELGQGAAGFHQALGEQAAGSGVDRIYATGGFAQLVADGALATGLLAEADVITGSLEAILQDLKRQLSAGDWVLVKGSRASGMEDIVTGLCDWAGAPQGDNQHTRR